MGGEGGGVILDRCRAESGEKYREPGVSWKGKSAQHFISLRDFPRKNTPMPNDTYYVSFPLGIDEFPAVDLTE
jgi:hypothetical protein